MSIENIWREGSRPSIAPDAGHRREVSWTLPDWRAFDQALRSAFPNIFLHEEIFQKFGDTSLPELRIVKRLDEPGVKHDICVMFPYPGWKPEFELVRSRTYPYEEFQAWKNYLSPQLTFTVRKHNEPFDDHWSDNERTRTFSTWGMSTMLTSFRKQIPAERKLVAKILRMIESRCRQVVPVQFSSHREYLAGIGKIWSGRLRMARCLASPAVIEWARAAPGRFIHLNNTNPDRVEAWIAPEDTPDSWWGDLPRPKWARP